MTYAMKMMEECKEGLREGMQKGLQKGKQEGILAAVQSAMKNLNSLERALDVLSIPETEHAYYRSLLQNA